MSLPERILAFLGESPLPVPTPHLVAVFAAGLSYPRNRVWAVLRKLKADGLVACHPGRMHSDHRDRTIPVTLWRLV